MARKLCSLCQIRTIGTGPGDEDPRSAANMGYCVTCFTEGGWENTHSDYAHEDVLATPEADRTAEQLAEINGCWMCYPELNPNTESATRRQGHHNTIAKSRTSHAGHGHPCTPKDRAACRKFMAAHDGMDEVTYRVAQREAELDA